jgi:hypothetical protein
MAALMTSEEFPSVTLSITNSAGAAASVDGVPVWASSDATVLAVIVDATGMNAKVSSVAPGTARITVTADADLGAGTVTITGVSEDVTVTQDPAQLASLMSFNFGAAAAKTPAAPPAGP